MDTRSKISSGTTTSNRRNQFLRAAGAGTGRVFNTFEGERKLKKEQTIDRVVATLDELHASVDREKLLLFVTVSRAAFLQEGDDGSVFFARMRIHLGLVQRRVTALIF